MTTAPTIPSGRSGPARRPLTWRRPAALALGLLLVVAACAPASGGGTATTTTTTTTTPEPSLLCKLWEVKRPTGPNGEITPSAFIYELEPEVVASALEVSRSGADCNDPAAGIVMHDVIVTGKDLHFPANSSLDQPPQRTTPYPQTIGAGRPQAPSFEIATLNLQLTAKGIRIYGTLRMKANGAVSIISFDGTYLNLQNFSAELRAPAVNLPGLTVAPLSVIGRFERVAGINHFSLDASAPELQVGELYVRDVVLHLAADSATGLSVSVSGRVDTAGNSAALSLAASFDSRGQLDNVDGALALDVSALDPNGDLMALSGSVSFSGNANSVVASFAGTGTFGGDTVAKASASVQIAPDGVVTLDGIFELDQGGRLVELSGTIVYDGSQAVPTLSAILDGHFYGTTAAGEIVEIRGSITVTNTGGVVTTSIDGDLRVGALRGRATADVTYNGDEVILDLQGAIDVNHFAADVQGRIRLLNGSVESVSLAGQMTGWAPVGDVGVNGSIAVSGDHTGVSLMVDGSIVGPGIDVQGAAVVVMNAAGKLVSLQATVSGRVSQGSWTVTQFVGTVSADDQGLTAVGAGLMGGPGIAYGSASGVLEVTSGVPHLTLTGQVAIDSGTKRVFGDFRIVDGRLDFANVGLVLPTVFFDPERLWLRLSYSDTGSCTSIDVVDATPWTWLTQGWRLVAIEMLCPPFP